MNGISVFVVAPTNAGRLYPEYSRTAGILAVGSKVERPWPFGVDIDGRLVFDLDDDRVLANFDLHISRSLWKVKARPWPTRAQDGNIVFSREAITQKSFSLPLETNTDNARGYVEIKIGEARNPRKIALSQSCVALVDSELLVGFFVRVPSRDVH